MLCNLKRYAATVRRSRYLLLGIVTLLFGIAILTFNFGNEYLALRGTTPFRELPSIASAVIRLGAVEPPYVEAALLQPSVYWPEQLYRIGIMTLPYAALTESKIVISSSDTPTIPSGRSGRWWWESA